MSLIIIAQKEVEQRFLNDALYSIDPQITAVQSIENLPKGAYFSHGLVVITPNNKEKAIKLAESVSLFAIATFPLEEKEITFFEHVFSTPLRLGSVIQVIKNTMAAQEQRKALTPITLGELELDPKMSFLREKNGQRNVRLTEKEAAILICLTRQSKQPIARSDLLNQVWQYAQNVETHTLETHIYRLRQKIKNGLGVSNFLVTDENGYRLQF